jgi:hypothetical protein
VVVEAGDAAAVEAGAVVIAAATAAIAETAGKQACRDNLAAFEPFGAPHRYFRELLQSTFAPGFYYRLEYLPPWEIYD